MARMLRLFGVLAGVAVVAGACQWPLDRFGPDRTSDSASDITISPANARHLTQQWTARLVSPGSDPVVADGHVFLTASAIPKSKLYGFEASGGTHCTATAPKTCRPQWSDSFPALVGQLVTSLSAPAVNGGAVWIGTSAFESPGDVIAGSMYAYSVSTGAPIVSGGQGRATSPAVTGQTVYASWSASGPPGTYTGLEAVDATTGASVFTAGPAPYGVDDVPITAPAVSEGTLYAVSGSTLYAFDATGTTNCGPPSPPLSNPFLRILDVLHAAMDCDPQRLGEHQHDAGRRQRLRLYRRLYPYALRVPGARLWGDDMRANMDRPDEGRYRVVSRGDRHHGVRRL